MSTLLTHLWLRAVLSCFLKLHYEKHMGVSTNSGSDSPKQGYSTTTGTQTEDNQLLYRTFANPHNCCSKVKHQWDPGSVTHNHPTVQRFQFGDYHERNMFMFCYSPFCYKDSDWKKWSKWNAALSLHPSWMAQRYMITQTPLPFSTSVDHRQTEEILPPRGNMHMDILKYNSRGACD